MSNKLKICGKEDDLEVVSEENEINETQDNASENQYPVKIDEAMLSRRAVAAVDTSVDERHIAVAQVVTTLNNELRCTNQVESSNWT